MKFPIYLDYMATTPVDPRVAKAMANCLTIDGVFGNPSSTSHDYGLQAAEKINRARKQVANLIHAEPEEIIWTSGATEANNLAIKGAARFYSRKGKHIITCKTEHKAVLDPCAQLAREGFEITYLMPDKNGVIDLARIQQAFRPDTVLISIMHVNNEIGVIQDINAIGKIAHANGILFHVDAAQSLGKIPMNLAELPVDLMSFSAHKIYGPKGVGALFIRYKPRIRIEPLIYGGGQEMGLRPGTLATHQIVGMGEACEIAEQEMQNESARILKLREKLWTGLNAQLSRIVLHGDMQQRVPGNLNIGFEGVDGEALLVGLKDLAVSSGAACNSATIEPSYVLRALGVNDNLAYSSIRFSIGRFTTEEDINFAITQIVSEVKRIRAISPLELY